MLHLQKHLRILPLLAKTYRDGGIIKYRFIKNPDSYAGVISVAKAEEKAKKVLGGI
jgi:hypothetical protein